MQIAPKNENSVMLSDNFKSVSFGIKQDGLAHIFGVLRNQLYSDKILAVVREYSANAVDANVEAGKEDQAIVITAPNSFDPTFRVRDFGNGLNEEEIRDIYANYGESTKRKSNKLIGQLGLGSKSAFAYGDNFVIDSYVNGKKFTYNAYIDPSQIGMIAKMNEEETSEPNGVEICVPVKYADIYDFTEKIKNFFKFWSSKVEVRGIDASEISLGNATIEGTNWKYFSHKQYSATSFPSVVVMGNVAYPFNSSIMSQEIKNLFSEKVGRDCYAPSLAYNFIFYVDIGTVEVSASREDLQYTDFTKKNLVQLLDGFFSELIEKINGKIENAASIFEAKRLFQETFCNLFSHGNAFSFLGKKCNWKGLDVSEPDVDFHFSQDENLPDGHEPAVIKHYFTGRRSRKGVNFYLETKLSSGEDHLNVIDDCDSKYLKKRMIDVIVNKKSYKIVNVITVQDQELWEKALAKRGLDGYTFKKLSEIEVSVPVRLVNHSAKTPSIRNKKHLKHTFTLDLTKNIKCNTNSSYWNPVVVDLNNDTGVWMKIHRFGWVSDPPVGLDRLIISLNDVCSFANVSANFIGFKEVPKKINNNINLIELKDWIIKTVADGLKAKGQLDDFINYIMTNRTETSCCQRGAVALFRRQKDSQTVINSQDIQDFLKQYEKIISIKKQTAFINIHEALNSLHCVNLFLLAYSSGTQVNLFDNLNNFFNKYPLLSLVDTSFFDWANKPETDETILSIFN
jgi:hypothetical protein